MAFILPFEDSFGNNYDTSYWYPGRIIIDKNNNVAVITFLAFKDKSARDAGKLPISERHITVQGNVFDTYLQKIITGDGNALALVYELALSHKDVKTDVNDENGAPVMKSFFQDATAD